MKFLKFSRKQTERRFEILKFLGAKRFGLRTAAEFLKFASEPLRNRSEILNFTPKLRNGFGILKFMRASAHLADIAQNFISQRRFKILKLICKPLRAPRRTLPSADKAEVGRAARLTSRYTYDAIEKRRAVKFNHAGGYLNSACSVRRRIVRLRSAAARHGHEVGSAENFSKFDLTGALLNFISLPPRNRYEILNFTPELCKFKSAPAVRLNFISNSVPPASASKFENGVKFEGAAKFKRGAR